MPRTVRVSLFSAWRSPEHTTVEVRNLPAALALGKAEQRGIVVTDMDADPPTEWNGPGVDDRRADRTPEAPDPGTIDPESLATLGRMDAGHMVPVIDGPADCWTVETECGTSIVPADLVARPAWIEPGTMYGAPDAGDLIDDEAAEWDALTAALRDYVDGSRIREVTYSAGRYLARMSAPGYMDCTDWESHDTAQAAADSLILNHADDTADEV